MRSLAREDRDAFTEAKRKACVSWVDKEAVKVCKADAVRWVLTWRRVNDELVSNARLCVLGSDALTSDWGIGDLAVGRE